MAGASVTVTIKDSGAMKVVDKLRMSITGGVHEDTGAAQHDKGPLTVYEVAAVNEFGGGIIPARLWLRGWVTRGEAFFTQRIVNVMRNMILTQKFSSVPFGEVAEDMMKSIRARIEDGQIKPANAPLTLAKKRPETRPLYEHGQLVRSIHGRVEANNGWREKRS
jgi:hypothetical protein